MEPRKLVGVATILVLLGVTGCSAQSGDAGGAPESPTQSSAPTATTTVSQFASIIAERVSDWNVYIEKRFSCALDHARTDGLSKANAIACDFQAQTFVLKANSALIELDKLGEAPAEIYKLVERTKAQLAKFAKIDITNKCLSKMDTPDCQDAISEVTAEINYGDIESTLKAWGPYL